MTYGLNEPKNNYWKNLTRMDKALKDLMDISRMVGKDPNLVQGSSGNASVKTDDGKYMYIKASGTELKDVNSRKGWRRLDVAAVLSIIKDKSLGRLDTFTRETEVVNRLLKSCRDNVNPSAKPSVEAHLHSMLDKCVIHLHPVSSGSYVCAKKGRAVLLKLFKDWKYPPLWVPYFNPGYGLGCGIMKYVSQYEKIYSRKPAVLFLANHGLIVSAANPKDALKLVKNVIKICISGLSKPPKQKLKRVDNKKIQQIKSYIQKVFLEATGCKCPVVFYGGKDIRTFAALTETKQLLMPITLTLGELLFSNGAAMWLNSCEPQVISSKLKSQIKKGQKPSMSFLVKDIGLFVASELKAASVIRDVQTATLFMRYNAKRMGGIKSLNKQKRQFIDIGAV